MPVELVGGDLALGGLSLARVFEALRRLEPYATAAYVYDLDQLDARAFRLTTSFAPLNALAAYALKANSLPALLAHVRTAGLGADAGSLGELELAKGAGFDTARTILNGNGRTAAEAARVATYGIHSVNADHVGELDVLESAAARAETSVRVALRVNPGIATPGHGYVATGHEDAKFGVSPNEALEAWGARDRWPHLRLDGLHLHVGSQIVEAKPLERAVEKALDLVAAATERGATLGLVNLGGGFGVDYTGTGADFPVEEHAARIAARVKNRSIEWVFEPGRWLVASVGVLIAEVLWVKQRDGRRFVVLGAGMNDLLRPALYHARHRIVPVAPRAGLSMPATIVGPVCESADVFDAEATLPPIERGDLVAILDVGAYGASMASNYNGRGRLAEIVIQAGTARRARAGESPTAIAARVTDDALVMGD
jgi:diaminopimelate decarboxylase